MFNKVLFYLFVDLVGDGMFVEAYAGLERTEYGLCGICEGFVSKSGDPRE